MYQVVGHNFSGEGATPGLALRAFWREIERRAFVGIQPTGFEFLPARRQRSVYRRAN